MLKLAAWLLLSIPLIVQAQGGMLVLKKKNKHIQTFRVGDGFDMETVYNQRFKGIITAVKHDSVFLNGQPWHYAEIATVHRIRLWSGLLLLGTTMMVTGAGIVVLETTYGLIQGEPFSDWYSTAGLITAGSLIVVGYFIRRAYNPTYHIGKKYHLVCVDLTPVENLKPF